jgi:hypothetical protein
LRGSVINEAESVIEKPYACLVVSNLPVSINKVVLNREIERSVIVDERLIERGVKSRVVCDCVTIEENLSYLWRSWIVTKGPNEESSNGEIQNENGVFN